MNSQRQTLTFLRNRLREIGVQPDRRHGQNFLIDLNLIDVLVDAAMLEKHDVVLEVGAGMGSLTTRMARLAGHVVTVEIDANLAAITGEETELFENVTILQQDALRNKNQIHERVQQAVLTQLAAEENACFKLVANLPFNIATPLISNLLLWETPPNLMVVTIQRELAERIMAQPSTKDYSALSVWLQSVAEIELIRNLPPSVFWPRPKVESSIIRIAPQAAKREQINDLRFFHRFVRALFFHRRKFLRSVLCSAFKHELPKNEVDQILETTPFQGDIRAEELRPEQILALSEPFRLRLVELAEQQS